MDDDDVSFWGLCCGCVIFFVLLYIFYKYFEEKAPLWLIIASPFLVFIGLIISIFALYWMFRLIEFLFDLIEDFVSGITWRRNDRRRELETERWDEYLSNISLRFTVIDDLVSQNELDESMSLLENLKEELKNYPNHRFERNEFICEKIEPLIKKVKLQKKIMEKCTRLCNEFKSEDNNLEIGQIILKYCSKITNSNFSGEISDEFYSQIKGLKNRIDHILKETLIKTIIKPVVNPSINFKFFYSEYIDYFDLLEKWKILQKLKQKLKLNLEKINPEHFKEYIQKGSFKTINRNKFLLTKAKLQEIFMQDIGWLVRDKYEIKKIIKKRNHR